MFGSELSVEAFDMAAGLYASMRPRRDSQIQAGLAGPLTHRTLVFYTHGLTHGGAERVMAMIASEFADRGDAVTFIVDRVMPDHGLVLSPKLRLEVLSGSHGSQLRALVQLLKTIQPDLMISALSASNVKMASAALFAGMPRRHVMTWHGFPQAEPSLLSRLGYGMLPVLSRLAAYHVCVSSALLDFVRDRGVGAENSVRIYNPVDMRGLDFERIKKSADAPRLILSAGRLAPVKNFSLLLEAFSRLPEGHAQLVILGDGPERHGLEQHAQTLGLGGRVLLPGHVHDMREWFARADVFVLPSNSESFSNVVVEALSHGLPVVSTDCGGPREILDQGRFGTLVPCGDADAMMRAIRAALCDDGSQAQSRRQQAQQFDLDTAISQYDQLFARLIAARSGQVQVLHS